MSDYTSLWPILGGGAVGFLSSLGTSLISETRRREAERLSLTGAIVGEVSALIDISERRNYIEGLRELISRAKANKDAPDKSVWYHFSVRRNPFPVYDANLTRIGILRDPLPRHIARFYAMSSSILEDIADMREGKMQRGRDESIHCLEELLKLFEDTLVLGRKIVSDGHSP